MTLICSWILVEQLLQLVAMLSQLHLKMLKVTLARNPRTLLEDLVLQPDLQGLGVQRHQGQLKPPLQHHLHKLELILLEIEIHLTGTIISTVNLCFVSFL